MIRMLTQQAELECAGEKLERWLDALGMDDADGTVDNDGDNLRVINALAIQGATEAELRDAVTTARESGWSWSPIAMVLGTTRQAAVERFG
jgi:hypothetical protein